MPVIIARRAVFGGLVRPAEFLACCGGLPQWVDSIENLRRTSWLGFRPGDTIFVSTEKSRQWEQGPYWTWKHQLLIVAVLATVAFLLGRHRLPGWALTVLLMIAWAGFQGTVPEQVLEGVRRSILWIHGAHRLPTGTLL